MKIHLPIHEVDKLTDISLRKYKGIKYSRKSYNGTDRVFYTIQFQSTKLDRQIIIADKLDATHSEITFPIHIQNFNAYPLPRAQGGSVLVYPHGVSKEESSQTNPVYNLFRAVLATLRKHEYFRAADVERMEIQRQQQPLKPQQGAKREEFFYYKIACEEAGIDYSLKELAKDINISYGQTRNIFPNWKRSQGLT